MMMASLDFLRFRFHIFDENLTGRCATNNVHYIDGLIEDASLPKP